MKKIQESSIQWNGSSGDWATPADWSTDAIPGSSDDTVIAGPGSYTVTVTALESVGSVLLSDRAATLRIQSGGTLAVSGSLRVKSGTVLLDGTLEGGTLDIDPGGTLETSSSDDPLGTLLQDVTELGGLTLDNSALSFSGNTVIQNKAGTGPGSITLTNSTIGLFENYTFDKLTLNGGRVGPGHGVITVEQGGLVQGYGGFFNGPGGLSLHNEGTINANVSGQVLNLFEIPFVNDGLVLAGSGGKIEIDYTDSAPDQWSNDTNGVISAKEGGTLSLGGNATNYGLISGVNSTIVFGDGIWPARNAGDILVSGDTLTLGALGGASGSVTDSGLIATVNTAVDVESPITISDGGTLTVKGGSLTGSANIEDAGRINIAGASIAPSLTIDVGGKLSGFGTVTNAIANAGTVTASLGTLDLAGPITGAGLLQIGARATLELGGTTTEATTFEGSQSVLLLDTANLFSGTIAGMAQSDSVNLANFAFSGDPVINGVTGTGAVGTTTDVTISDGSLTTTLDLLNQYASQFAVDPGSYHLASDHSGSNTAGTFFTLANPHV